MAALKGYQIPVRSTALHPRSPPPSTVSHLKKPKPRSAFHMKTPKKTRVSRSMGGSDGSHATRCSNLEGQDHSAEEDQRPPFDLNLAVLLAGFAFEAYSTPPSDVGWREIDAAECQTVFLSEQFLCEVYDGQLFIKLRKGVDFPAMDPWGTSDPYVIIQLDSQVAKSKVKWATKEPIWNEDFTLHTKISSTRSLQVAAWDANLLTAHKRMGNAEIKLESLCDGNLHEVVVELEGIGGGGKIYLEVKYKSKDEIDEEKQWWRIPFVSDFLMKSPLGSALKMVLGSQSVNASQFVQAAFGQLRSINNSYLQKHLSYDGNSDEIGTSGKSYNTVASSEQSVQQMSPKGSMHNSSPEKEGDIPFLLASADATNSSFERNFDESELPDKFFWQKFSDILNQSVLQKLGFSLPEIKSWDGFDLLTKMSMQSQRIAEEDYIESGLETPERKEDDDGKSDLQYAVTGTGSSIVDIKKASWDVLSQTETILGALMVLTSTLSQQENDSPSMVQDENTKNASVTEAEDIAGSSMNEIGNMAIEGLTLDAEVETRKLFSSAESAMEAWAMLATSLGRTSFIKSEFEKICFLDNVSTDTQVAIWRDFLRRRLVVAFRGTEQVKWKDLRTDLMLLPAGLNPERLGGDFKQEVQVHSGFLNAYDSVRTRIMTLVKLSICPSVEDGLDSVPKWHVYVTGHSLGGALATLLALELSSSRMAKHGAITVTMYNFGSPRVGNRRFAEVYNEKVKDSWRVVNHRDIIPSVPRLMGYCHVAQPVYLAARDLGDALVNMEIQGDGYQGDVIGESTPDVLVSQFMKGEKQLVEKILQTEINLLRSIRDGTALMQHMEDFYYITLLERVQSNYKRIDSSRPSIENFSSTV